MDYFLEIGFLDDYFFRSLAAPLISVLPIFLSSPCFVVGYRLFVLLFF